MTTRARDRRRTWRHTSPRASPRRSRPPSANGIGDPDDEEEGREDEVRDRHAVEVGGPVAQELGRPGDAGDLVHEQHEEDVGSAEKIDREDARGAGGGGRSGQAGPPRMSTRRVPGSARAYNAVHHRGGGNGSQGLPGASRRGAARLGRSCRGRGALATASSAATLPRPFPACPVPGRAGWCRSGPRAASTRRASSSTPTWCAR